MKYTLDFMVSAFKLIDNKYPLVKSHEAYEDVL